METMCWRCNTVYPYESTACPMCAAINANHDTAAAYKEMADAGVTERAHHARLKEITELKTPNAELSGGESGNAA